MQKIIDGLCKGISAVMVVSLAVMVVLVFGNVFMRYAFNSGFTLSEELPRWFPLNTVADIEGLKLRVIPNPINVAWVKALGANPTPMSFPEVYGGLEQKAIDGQENSNGVIAANKFWEVQKHMALTNHQYNPQSVIFSKKVWDTLSPAEKTILDDSADEAAKGQREASRAAVAANLDLLKKNGMAVTVFSPIEVAKLREKMKPVITQFSANVGEATVNEMMAELAKLRK